MTRPSRARAGGGGAGGKNSVYSAQTLADFCEVDLKTVHHWADKGKVSHFRTDGRHLRFRRNDVVRFLRAHGYPLPEALVRARPTVALALVPSLLEAGALSLDELAKRLGSRFSVRRHSNGASAVAHLVAEAPDVLVVGWDDPSLRFPGVIAALKDDAATAWVAIAAIVTDPGTGDSAEDAPKADVMLATRDVAKLPGELARLLAVLT